MRKASSVVLEVIAAFFFYLTGFLAFAKELSTGPKLVLLIVFSALGLAGLGSGLALTRFRNWRTVTGTVLLCGAGMSAMVFSMILCIYMTEEMREFMKPETFAFFSDYWTGGSVTIGMAILGGFLVKVGGPTTVEA